MLIHYRNATSLKVQRNDAHMPTETVSYSSTIAPTPFRKQHTFQMPYPRSGVVLYGINCLSRFDVGKLVHCPSFVIPLSQTTTYEPQNCEYQLHQRSAYEYGKGKLVPSRLPDFSDLALLPKSVKIMLWQSLVKSETYDELLNLVETLQNLTATSVTMCTESYELCVGPEQLHLNSFASTIKLLHVEANSVAAVSIEISTTGHTCDWRDGRRSTSVVSCEESTSALLSRPKRRKLDTLLRKGKVIIAIWNCRGMDKDGFFDVYDYIVENLAAHVVVLTETRCPEFLANVVLRSKTPSSLSMSPTKGLTDGSAVVCVYALATVSLIQSSSDVVTYHIAL